MGKDVTVRFCLFLMYLNLAKPRTPARLRIRHPKRGHDSIVRVQQWTCTINNRQLVIALHQVLQQVKLVTYIRSAM